VGAGAELIRTAPAALSDELLRRLVDSVLKIIENFPRAHALLVEAGAIELCVALLRAHPLSERVGEMVGACLDALANSGTPIPADACGRVPRLGRLARTGPPHDCAAGIVDEGGAERLIQLCTAAAARARGAERSELIARVFQHL